MSVSEILNAAADDIEQNGWGQGVGAMYEDSNHCALGAIGAAYERLSDANMTNEMLRDDIGDMPRVGRLRRRYYEPRVGQTPAARALARYLEIGWVPAWNDNAESSSVVIEALRAAAVIEAAREEAEAQARAEVRDLVAA